MKPMTRSELFMATAAGEYSGELPEPIIRPEFYWQKIAQRIDAGGSVSPESIDAAIADYINTHDADIVTEAELTDALEGKADSADIPDVSGFIGVDVNNLTNYYDKDTVDAALAGKQAALTAGENITIADNNGDLTISATDTTYSDATQQTHGLMSAADKTKLDGITAAKMQAWDVAEQNVNADWTAESGDAQILHKPDLSVYALAANVTKSALGIDNVDNTSDADKPISTAAEAALSGKANASHTHAQSDVTGLETALLGKANASHSHDDRYYTETEIDTALSGKSNTGHSHDDRYYTESEVDTLLSGKADGTDIPDVSSFITKTVNDLTYYYTKSETYTQSEIDNMVSAIPKFAIEVVQALPLQDISPTTVYLLTVQSGQQSNMYDEYIHVGNSWELLGTQTVDLSGYYTSAQVDALLNGLPVAGHTHDDRYYTEAEIDGKIQNINAAISGKAASGHTHDDRYYTETEIDTALSGKSNTGHSHAMTDVTGLDSALASKADATATQTALAGKQNALTAGANITIETVNGVLTISATDTTYSEATTLVAGLMSAIDKIKLDACKKIVVCNSESAYNSLTKDSDTVYMILEETT